jgi:predicted ABC-type ATPase
LSSTKDLRLRVFAGPNGSGKSTVINAIIRNGSPLLGLYINADDIAKKLISSSFSFQDWDLEITKDNFIEKLKDNSLIVNVEKEIPIDALFEVEANCLKMVYDERKHIERIAQIMAEFLRICCLEKSMRFSFETVFSHPSKVEWMKKARDLGYKVYFYFVSTESPEINKTRVKNRVLEGGHDVPENKIEERYYRSLDLMYEASQFAYQAFYFDNSTLTQKGNENWFAHFKRLNGKAEWDEITDREKVPNWFIKYYVNKQIGYLNPKD